MKQMVITFDPDGTVHHTLKDTFLNVGEILGAKRSIHRMTNIEFDEDLQKFFAKFLVGEYLGESLVGEPITFLPRHKAYGVFGPEVAYFDSYEEAVEAEIDIVNELRRRGAKL